MTRDETSRAPQVPARAMQGAGAKTLPGRRAKPRAGMLAEASIWTERMVSALVNGVKGGKWYSVVDKVYARRTLDAAWEKVRANKGASCAWMGKVCCVSRTGQKAIWLNQATALKDGSYRPEAVKRVDIPKGDGRTRPLGIPTVKDRIVQTAVKMVIEPIFEAGFCEGSYGFRPGRGVPRMHCARWTGC